MSYASITAAQRAELSLLCERVAKVTHRATEDYRAVPITDTAVLDGKYVTIDKLLTELDVLVSAAVV